MEFAKRSEHQKHNEINCDRYLPLHNAQFTFILKERLFFETTLSKGMWFRRCQAAQIHIHWASDRLGKTSSFRLKLLG